jgi:3-hydroxyacyl-CoA dehydrogenase
MDRIETSTDLGKAVGKADLVVEAIMESLEMKHGLFETVDAHAPAGCILASNTSSLGIADICAPVVGKRGTRFAGLHFFNPVPQMKLVEVIRLAETSPDVVEGLLEFCKGLGKTPVAVKDTPGFIVNRLLVPYMRDNGGC